MTAHLHLASVGIDLGSSTTKIAAAKRGGIEILTNQANFRQTPTIVGFGEDERKIGETGNIKLKSNFRDSVIAPMRFFAASANSQMAKTESKFCPAKVDTNNKDLVFSIKYQNKPIELTPEQVTAAFLNKLQTIIKNHDLNAKEIVLAVPAYFTQAERQAIFESAEIAGIKLNKIVNDSTAVAMDYGISRKSEFEERQARNVLFIDFGHSKFSSYVCSFKKDSVAFVDQVHSRNLGCRDIDNELFEFYRNLFMKQTGQDVLENKKACMKLRGEIEKQRKTLSGNKEQDLSIEYLVDENDLQYTMKREEWQEIAKSVFNELAKKLGEIKKLIIQKRIPIHSIELLGGGTRIPLFLELVNKLFGIEPSRTLNSSETVAKGAAIVAAVKSPIFRVANYNVQELSNYGMIVSWSLVRKNNLHGLESAAYPQKQRKLLCEAGQPLKEMELKINTEQSLEILVEYDTNLPGGKDLIAYLITHPQKKYREAFGTIVKFNFDENGMLQISESFMEEIEQEHPQQQYRNNRNDFGFFGGMGGYGGNQTPRKQPQPRKDLVKTPLQIEEIPPYSKSSQEIQKLRAIENDMSRKDKDILETYEKKNELESLIYSAKEKLNDSSYQEFVEAEKLNEHIQVLNDQGNWLYEEQGYAPKMVYEMKIKAIEEFMTKIIKRRWQYRENKDRIDDFVSKLEVTERKVDGNLRKTKVLQERKEWIANLEAKINQDKLAEVPAELCELDMRIKDLEETLANLDMDTEADEDNCEPKITEEDQAFNAEVQC